MQWSREPNPVSELFIRLLIVTALTAITFPFFADSSRPAEQATNQQSSNTAPQTGSRK